MDSNFIINKNIFTKLKKEYLSSKLDWSELVISKDLGIICVDVFYLDRFKLVDEKKWLLAKIKYGF